MATKSTVNTDKAFFVGGYVTEMTDFIVASAVSGVHAWMFSEPGWGKTRITISVLESIWGAENVSIIRFAPTTPPEVIEGTVDVAELLDNGKFRRIVDGTPYDPKVRAVGADELQRALDPIFDKMLDVTDRFEKTGTAHVVATSNFALASERTAALRDRFGLTLWIAPSMKRVSDFVKSALNGIGERTLSIDAKLPDSQTIDWIHTLKPGEDQINLIVELIENLSSEATEQLFKINPRRTDQWSNILYRLSVYYSGTESFNSIPPQASAALRWAWPSTTQDEASRWSAVAGAISDLIGNAVDMLVNACYDKVRELQSSYSDTQRSAMAQALGELVATAKSELEEIGSDRRVDEAIAGLHSMLFRVSRGEDPFGE